MLQISINENFDPIITINPDTDFSAEKVAYLIHYLDNGTYGDLLYEKISNKLATPLLSQIESIIEELQDSDLDIQSVAKEKRLLQEAKIPMIQDTRDDN